VVRAVDEGRPRDEIIEVFGVSRATIKRYLKQQRETGELTAKAIPGRPAKKGDALYAQLLSQLEANRDATLEDHCQMWEAKHGEQVSTKTMSRAITRLGWTRKKTVRAKAPTEQQSPTGPQAMPDRFHVCDESENA